MTNSTGLGCLNGRGLNGELDCQDAATGIVENPFSRQPNARRQQMVIGRADDQQVVGTALQVGTNGIRWGPGNEMPMFTGNPMRTGEIIESLLAGVVPGQVTLI